MEEFRPLLIASIFLTVIAAVAWGAAADWTMTGAEPRAVYLLRPAAIDVSAIAAVCWGVLSVKKAIRRRDDRQRAEYRRREVALIRMADRTPPTVPFPRS